MGTFFNRNPVSWIDPLGLASCSYSVSSHSLSCAGDPGPGSWSGHGLRDFRPYTFNTSAARSGNNNNDGNQNRQCMNNPDCENIPDVGPLPRGEYSIGPDRNLRGNTRITLQPLFDISRGGFQIHRDWNVPGRTGDLPGNLPAASEGCIALDVNDYMRLRGFLRRFSRGTPTVVD